MLTRRLLLLVTVVLTLSASASAAPTAEVALDRYRLALEGARLDLDRQGVLFETLDGRPLLAYNVDCPFNPASVVKLATSDVALARLGPNHRFGTAFYTNGALDTVNGILVGDLVVVGSGDPSMTTEHAFYVARELRARGIRIITGNVVVKGPLYCNYSMNRESAGSTLIAALDVERWNGSIEYAFGRYQVHTRATTFEGVTIEGDVVVANDTSVAGLTPLFTLRSMPLLKILKQLNNFSNNWMAHIIGDRVGGATGVRRTLGMDLRISGEDFRLQTTSGLGSNAMRPTDVVAMLRHLQSSLATNTLAPSHLMPVAGIDPGTLEDRYLAPHLRGAVVAKTGTLRSVSALAGYMYTRDRGVVVFAILNQGGTPAKFRRLQDQLVTEMFEACGGPAPLLYQRPVGFGETAGAFIERAPGNIPEAPPVVPEASN